MSSMPSFSIVLISYLLVPLHCLVLVWISDYTFGLLLIFEMILYLLLLFCLIFLLVLLENNLTLFNSTISYLRSPCSYLDPCSHPPGLQDHWSLMK